MKKIISLLLVLALFSGTYGVSSVKAETAAVKELKLNKRKRNKGYQKPRSKKILGIFKRKTDCGCPKH